MLRKTSFKHNSYEIIAMGVLQTIFQSRVVTTRYGDLRCWSQKKVTPFVTTDPGTGVSKAKGAEEVLILTVDDKGVLV